MPPLQQLFLFRFSETVNMVLRVPRSLPLSSLDVFVPLRTKHGMQLRITTFKLAPGVTTQWQNCLEEVAGLPRDPELAARSVLFKPDLRGACHPTITGR